MVWIKCYKHKAKESTQVQLVLMFLKNVEMLSICGTLVDPGMGGPPQWAHYTLLRRRYNIDSTYVCPLGPTDQM